MKMKKLVQYTVGVVSLFLSVAYARTVVVIDAGHGGKDPGAIGTTLGIKEKNITLDISQELKALLDRDPNFKAVMTRKSDYFIQLPERTEIARKNKANILVSIHADSSPSSSRIGASVWVLSNRRASDEMGKWLEDHEKQSELLGGAGTVLSHTNGKYLNQTVLDLQFSHSQRTGYELGKTVLNRLQNVTSLAKNAPQHASLSVLRSPDITSILVETGFLSNPNEEQKLATSAYRKKIAYAIYNGLVAYRSQYLKNVGKVKTVQYAEVKEEKTEKVVSKTNAESKVESKIEKNKATAQAVKKSEKSTATQKESKSKASDETKPTRPEIKKSNTGYHVVQQDETLYSIARAYSTTPEKLSQLNHIKNNKIGVGQKLKVK